MFPYSIRPEGGGRVPSQSDMRDNLELPEVMLNAHSTAIIHGDVAQAIEKPVIARDLMDSANSAFGAFSNDGVFPTCDLYLTIPTNEAYAAPSLEGTFAVSFTSAM